MDKSGPQHTESPSKLIDVRIKELGDWRGEMLSLLPRPGQGGRSRRHRGVEVERGPGLVA